MIKTYTLKVPVTVSLADLAADSRSNPNTVVAPSSASFEAAYEFQSDKRDDPSLPCSSSFPLLPPENQARIFLMFGFGFLKKKKKALKIQPFSWIS